MASKASARDFSSLRRAIADKRLRTLGVVSSTETEASKQNQETVIARLKAVDELTHTFLGVLKAVHLLEKPVLEITAYRINVHGGFEVEIGELKPMLISAGADGDEVKDLVWFRFFEIFDADSNEYFRNWMSKHEPEKTIKKSERLVIYVYDFNQLPKSESYSMVALAPRVQILIPDPPASVSVPVPEEKKEEVKKEVPESKKRKAEKEPKPDVVKEKKPRKQKEKVQVESHGVMIHGDGKEEAPIEDVIL